MTVHHFIIVGGVAAGMSAAARLRRLDEQATITVLEQGDHVSYAGCGLPYFLSGEIADQADLLVQTPAALAAALNLDVRTGHRVTGLDATAHTVHVQTPVGELDLQYDQLILAPGAIAARPIIPGVQRNPIPGLDDPRVHTLRTVADAVALRDLVTSTAGRAAVIGAGFIGLETAEALQRAGLDVTLIEATPHVLPPLEDELAWPVTQELTRLGVHVRSNVALARIKDAGDLAELVLTDGSRLMTDLVLLAVGSVPATQTFASAGLACDERGAILVDEHGRTNLPCVWAAGDATTTVNAVTGAQRDVALAGPANRTGRLVADAIAGTSVRPRQFAARPIPAALGTAIVRVGKLTAAVTGANSTQLEQAGIAFTTLHTHPLDHAGYFPGAQMMHLVVHMDPTTGRLLGAQAVGAAGVDKRIDVLATAIRAGLTAPALMDLDLCYAPPYGAAKDAITMIGLLADNVLTGVTRLWYPHDLHWARHHALLLDVRTRGEYAAGHLPEALNIPHTQLRGRLDEVRDLAGGRPIAVMCRSGVRSYIAHRVLTAAGFDSRTLSGGSLTLADWLGARANEVFVTRTWDER
ncbi:MAG: FAD-dependent oxidoreductase [Propionibacteriaceae bacterium]|nr:FAD-dependent oxidoreductase [Propionibacteriaceae bacterium]